MIYYRPARDIVDVTAPGKVRDLLEQGAAHALARELDEWWAKRGFPQVRNTVFNQLDRVGELWCVRSNLQNGMPPVAADVKDAA